MAETEKTVLVLQGGGALGAYQAGAFEVLSTQGYAPDWVAGISIGAINAAIICGNPVDRRVERLHDFWYGITAKLAGDPWFHTSQFRRTFDDVAAAMVVAQGVPGFFAPRPVTAFLPFVATPPVSIYDTAPLIETLERLVDFDYLNDHGPRLSVGAVDIETGNFVYFDSAETRITPAHILASGALPPGFPPVEIDGRFYWDGGLVSNTPLQYVLISEAQCKAHDPLCIFQIDVFSARGDLPEDLAGVSQREKDIRFSSRTRLTTDRFRQLYAMRAALDRLAEKMPEDLRSDPDLALLRDCAPGFPVALVHLIHRKEDFEGATKDYEFSRLSMTEHWDAGARDVTRTLSNKRWKHRVVGQEGLQVFDLGARNP